MSKRDQFPRPPTPREAAWLDYLLPADRPGYAEFAAVLRGLAVLGEGRWGAGDLALGRPGLQIDSTAGMKPVVAYGEIEGTTEEGVEVTVTLSLHQPDEDDIIEFQTASLQTALPPEHLNERRRWSYSYWSPGGPCPATGSRVREIAIDERSELVLAVSPAKRSIWLFDVRSMMNTLIPITNFYNELMLLKGIRDPRIALDHKGFFTEPSLYSDADIRNAFRTYNAQFRKVDPERVVPAENALRERMGLARRIRALFGGGQ